jgi:magnesium-transporting ATPase (P-type)
MAETKFPIKIDDITEFMQVNIKADEQQKYLNQHGNVVGMCEKLKVNPLVGLSNKNPQDLASRVEQFGRNEIPAKPPKSFLHLMWEALQDTTLIILIVCAVISLGLSFYHDPGQAPTEQYSQIGTVFSNFVGLLFIEGKNPLILKKSPMSSGSRAWRSWSPCASSFLSRRSMTGAKRNNLGACSRKSIRIRR